jgi:hypothetical protein
LGYLPFHKPRRDDEKKGQGCALYPLLQPDEGHPNAAFRQAALQEAEEALHAYAERLVKPGKQGRKPDPKNTIVKVAEILTQKTMQSFFDVDYDGQTLTFPMKQH